MFRANFLASQMGKKIKDPGAVMYHAADAVAGGGEFNSEKRHRIKLALYKQRLRASGMTDDILGSKEVAGAFENPYEAEMPG